MCAYAFLCFTVTPSLPFNEKGKFAGPEHVLASSSAVVWWRCPVAPDHVWASSVASRVEAYQLHKKKRAHGERGAITTGEPRTTRAIKGRLEGLLRSPPAKGSCQSSDPGAHLPGATSVIMSPLAKGKENNQTVVVVPISPLPPTTESAMVDSNCAASIWGCPCCAGKQVSVTNSLVALAPRVARLWHPTANRACVGSGSSRGSTTSGSDTSGSSMTRGQGAKAATPPAVRAREVMAESLASCVLRCCPNSKGHARSFPSVRQACAEAATAEAAANRYGSEAKSMCWWQCQPCAEEAASFVMDLVVNAATRDPDEDANHSDEEEESETEVESSEEESEKADNDDADDREVEQTTAVLSEATTSSSSLVASAKPIAVAGARTGPGWWVTDMRGRVHQQLKKTFTPASQVEADATPVTNGPVDLPAAVAPTQDETSSKATKSQACVLS